MVFVLTPERENENEWLPEAPPRPPEQAAE